MYQYKHKTTGEVIQTSNKVTSKNWIPVKEEKKPSTPKTSAPKSGTDKAGGTKNSGAKKGETKKDTPKKEAEEQ